MSTGRYIPPIIIQIDRCHRRRLFSPIFLHQIIIFFPYIYTLDWVKWININGYEFHRL